MNQIASILAFIIGIMSIVAGGKAMRDWDPGYSVIAWLPVYNFGMGILTLIPADMFRSAIFTDIVGLALGGALLAREIHERKKGVRPLFSK